MNLVISPGSGIVAAGTRTGTIAGTGGSGPQSGCYQELEYSWANIKVKPTLGQELALSAGGFYGGELVWPPHPHPHSQVSHKSGPHTHTHIHRSFTGLAPTPKLNVEDSKLNIYISK